MLEEIKDALGATFGGIFGVAWTFGGVIGAIYWAVQGNLLQVVLSIFIPLWGALSVIWDLIYLKPLGAFDG